MRRPPRYPVPAPGFQFSRGLLHSLLHPRSDWNARSDWNDTALQGVFTQGLSDDLKDELAVREEPGNLEALIGLITCLDNRLRERHRQSTSQWAVRNSGSIFRCREAPGDSSASVPVPAPEVSPSEPMQLGQTCLTQSERQHWCSAALCLYCSHMSHFLADCLVRPKRLSSSTPRGVLASGSSSCLPLTCLTLSDMLLWGQEAVCGFPGGLGHG